jgi:hypothetical protein
MLRGIARGTAVFPRKGCDAGQVFGAVPMRPWQRRGHLPSFRHQTRLREKLPVLQIFAGNGDPGWRRWMLGTMVQAPGLSPTGAWPDQPFVLRILRRVGALTMVSDLSKA